MHDNIHFNIESNHYSMKQLQNHLYKHNSDSPEVYSIKDHNIRIIHYLIKQKLMYHTDTYWL